MTTRSGTVVFLIATCVIAVLFGCGQAQQESIVNPGFEQSDSSPTGWFLDSEAGAKGEVTVIDQPVHQGRRVLRLAPNAKNLGGPKPLGVGQLISASGYRNHAIQLSAALAGSGGAVAAAGFAALDRSGRVLAEASLRGQNQPPLRVQTSSPERIPPTAQSLVVYLVVEGQRGEAFFDEIAIRIADSEALSTIAAKRAATVVKIALDRELSPVRHHLFGTNIEWIRNAQGLWNERTRAVDDQVVGLASDARVSLLRFPGGGWSDAYDWRNGVGPRDQRPRAAHTPGDREQSPNSFGTDELIEVAKRIGADVLFTLNLGSGTPALAADWVRYVRERVGVLQSPRLIWELGNELYMKGDVSGGALSPEAYVEKARATIAAVRAVDPSATIYAIGLQNYGRYRFNSYDDWNEKVLRGLADRIEGLAIHNAYAPVLAGRTGAAADSIYRSMLAAPMNIAANLETTIRQLQSFEGGKALSLAITEWGPLFTIDPKNPFFDHVKTLGSGIFVARTLNVFLRSPRVAIANFFKLTDLLNMGWIGRKPGGGFAATPAMQVFRLYSGKLRGHLLATEVSGPSFASSAAGFVDAVERAPIIDAVAARGAGGEIAIIVSNANLTEEENVEIQIAGKFAGEIELLTGPAPDAHSGTVMISVPGINFATTANFGRPRPTNADEITSRKDAIEADGSFSLKLPACSIAAITLRTVR